MGVVVLSTFMNYLALSDLYLELQLIDAWSLFLILSQERAIHIQEVKYEGSYKEIFVDSITKKIPCIVSRALSLYPYMNSDAGISTILQPLSEIELLLSETLEQLPYCLPSTPTT